MNTYFDDNGVEKLICPICGCKGFSRLKSHLYNSHPDTLKEDVLKMYPDTKFVSQGLHDKQSEATKKQSVINKGYNFMFITEHELEDLFSSELYNILSGATTIESIA